MERDENEDRPVLDLPVIPMDNGEARARFLELEAQQRLTDEGGPEPPVPVSWVPYAVPL